MVQEITERKGYKPSQGKGRGEILSFCGRERQLGGAEAVVTRGQSAPSLLLKLLSSVM